MKKEFALRYNVIYLNKPESIIHEGAHLYHAFLDWSTNSEFSRKWLEVGHREKNGSDLLHPDTFIDEYASFDHNIDIYTNNSEHDYGINSLILKNGINFLFNENFIGNKNSSISNTLDYIKRMPNKFQNVIKNVVINPNFDCSHIYIDSSEEYKSVCEDVAVNTSSLYRLEKLIDNPNKLIDEFDYEFLQKIKSNVDNKVIKKKVELLHFPQYQLITSKQKDLFNLNFIDEFEKKNKRFTEKYALEFLGL